MQLTKEFVGGHIDDAKKGWTRFWFVPAGAHTLAVMRILVGWTILYTHLVWSMELLDFFGPDARITSEFSKMFHSSGWAWSHFHWVQQPSLMVVVHGLALLVFLMFTVGLFTRTTSILTFLLVVSYVHRVPGALFGLDQINGFLAMYLMLSECGAVFSVDAWRKGRAGGGSVPDEQPPATVMNNVAMRLIQIHMCIVYLFAALGKLQGISWWEGNAMWLALANYEYQTLDMTWLAAWPRIVNFLTHFVLVWELTYVALIWPRWTRPLVLLFAIPVHLGIALTMGMATFGMIMLFGNLAFVSPKLVQEVVDSIFGRLTR